MLTTISRHLVKEVFQHWTDTNIESRKTTGFNRPTNSDQGPYFENCWYIDNYVIEMLLQIDVRKRQSRLILLHSRLWRRWLCSEDLFTDAIRNY